jgi:hypothetical protein
MMQHSWRHGRISDILPPPGPVPLPADRRAIRSLENACYANRAGMYVCMYVCTIMMRTCMSALYCVGVLYVNVCTVRMYHVPYLLYVSWIPLTPQGVVRPNLGPRNMDSDMAAPSRSGSMAGLGWVRLGWSTMLCYAGCSSGAGCAACWIWLPGTRRPPYIQ